MGFQPFEPAALVARLAAIVDSSEDAIIGVDGEGVINTWNRSATRLFGYQPEEILGQSLLLLVPPELHAEQASHFERLLAGERIEHYDTVRIAKGGRRVEVSLSVGALYAGDDFIGAAAIMRESGVRRREYAARARLAAIVESSDDAIAAKDLNGVVTEWNTAAERMFGYKREEIVGRSILTIIPPELQHEEAGILAKIRAGQPIEHYETERMHKSGRRLDVSLTISPIRDASGKIVGASKIARDITEQHQHDRDLLMLAAIVESSDDAIISKNMDGIIMSWNKAAERMFGYKAEEIVGHSVLRLIPRDLHWEEPDILARLRGGGRIEHYETRRMRKDGEVFDISLTVSPIKNQWGNIIGVSKIVRDISERKVAAALLLEREKLAAAGKMAATLAHEVNNPLESIMNLAYILAEDRSLPFPAREYASTLFREVQRAGEITRQVLTYYRQARVSQEVDLASTLEEVLKTKRNKVKAKRIDVKKEFDARFVHGIPGELRQVLDNMIENAIDACRQGGRIRVRTRNSELGSEKKLVVTIADNGSGIPPHVMPKVFQPFYTTKMQNGSGLGLWVALGIVQKHGGSIRVRSREQSGCSGSVFRISFPAAAASNSATVSPKSSLHLLDRMAT